jgi:hypothetical protein
MTSRGRGLPRSLAAGLAALALGACSLLPGGGGAGPSGGGGQAGQPFQLAGVCPNPVVIQTDWNPESEYGATYNLVGDGYRVDRQRQAVRGPLVVEGRPTGVDVEVRSGGPIIDFQTIKTFFDDRSITLSFMTTDEAARNYAAMPTISVVAPTEINPQILMWSPDRHPDWTTVVDIGQTNTPVLASADNAFPEFMIGSGILRRQQVNPKNLDPYDGDPKQFVNSGGNIVQQGFATAEPWLYQFQIEEWGRPVAFQLIHDTGYELYSQTLAIRTADKDKLAPCLRKLVPLVQRSTVDFARHPQRVNKLITDLVLEYDNGWEYPLELAEFSVEQQLALGLTGNGPDQTIGNFDVGRVAGVLDILRPIFAGQKQPLKEGLRAEDLVSNEFIDPAIGLSAPSPQPA